MRDSGDQFNQNKKATLMEKKTFLEEISKFSEYGSTIYRTDGLKEAAAAINRIVENAERIALEEADQEWFDDMTVKRNMKGLRSCNEQFMKTVGEAMKLQQRLESLYEEMGHTLSRYYEVR